MTYIIYYNNDFKKKLAISEIKKNIDFSELALIGKDIPLIYDKTVLENMYIPAAFKYRVSFDKAFNTIKATLNDFSMIYLINKYPWQLTSYESLVAKYIQTTYLEPVFTIFISPHQYFHSKYRQNLESFLLKLNDQHMLLIETVDFKNIIEKSNLQTQEVTLNQWLEFAKNLINVKLA